MSIEFQAFWEAVIGVLLLAGAAVLVGTNSKQIPEIDIFAVVLVLESLPFLAAVAIATLELSRANSFAFWRDTAVRTAELIGLRPVTLPVAPTRQVTAATDLKVLAPLAAKPASGTEAQGS